MKGVTNMFEKQPWSFAIEFDEDKAAQNGYKLATLYDYVGKNVEKYGLTRLGNGIWKAKEGDEVESQCLALSMLSNAKWVMQNVKSFVIFEDGTDEIDYLAILRRYAPQRLCV